MRFSIISPFLGEQAAYKFAHDAIQDLDNRVDSTGGLTDYFIRDNQTGRPLTRKQVDKYRK